MVVGVGEWVLLVWCVLGVDEWWVVSVLDNDDFFVVEFV